MSTDVESVNNESVSESGRRRRRHRHRRRRHPLAGGGSLDECRFPEIEMNVLKIRMNRVADCSSEDEDCVDLEANDDPPEKEAESECRICHLNAMEDDEEDVIELGCSCKGKLGMAHKHCAETWFRIKGDTKCEICSSEAANITVVVVQNEAVGGANATSVAAASSSGVVVVGAVVGPVIIAENGGSSWNGRRIMNILLGCIIMSFIISWLFHLRMLAP